MMKRLFLFAAWFGSGAPGSCLIHYLKSLSEAGDVILMADNDVKDDALDCLKPFTLNAQARHHKEYDFGSYKYCWMWAQENLRIEDYDFVYLVNDSVFGPLRDLPPYLTKMENSSSDASCLVAFPGKSHPHMQSWFVCLGKKVFLSDWFGEFLRSVRAEGGKEDVCTKYETGLSGLLRQHGITYLPLFKAPHKSIYNKPLKYFRQGLPFVKKSSFTRHNGCIGNQVRKILEECPAQIRSDILDEVESSLGGEFVERLERMNCTKAAGLYLGYLLGKITGKN